MSALSFYTISHDFTLAPTPYKGKNKGRKIWQQAITKRGNREAVTYVRIYYTGGFLNGQVHLR